MALAGRRGVPAHGRPAPRLLQPPALLRPGSARRVGEIAGNEPAASDRLTVVTFNIRAAIGPGPFPAAWWRQVDRARLERIGEIVAALDPDIVALQEVPLMTVDGIVTDMAGDVGGLLGLDGRYGGVHHLPVVEPEADATIGTYTWGNALLSRLPIGSSRTVALPIPADDDVVEPGGSGHQLAGLRYRDVEPGMREARCALVCDVATGSGTVHAISTHLTYIGSTQRRRQVEALAGLVDSLAGPVVLGGDLNAPIHAPELGPVRGQLVDAFLATGIPPVDDRRRSCGEVAIDHVLVRGLTPVTCRVVTEAGDASDHWPVVATVEP